MNLFERIKMYEKMETQEKFMPLLPIYARLDGRGFSKFTKNMLKPFDPDMSRMMQEVAKYLVQETQAKIAYTQSDEISLIFLQDPVESEIFFNAKKQKMISVLSGLCTAKFLEMALKLFPDECEKRLPVFDCRVFQVPSKIEAANCLLQRSQDAVRNSINMAGRAEFSHKELEYKTCEEVITMLSTKDINFNDYPKYFKEGSFFQRSTFNKTVDGKIIQRTKIQEVLTNFSYEELSTKEKVILIFGDSNENAD